MMHQGSDRCCGAWCYRLISAGWRSEGAACHQRSSAAHPHVIKGVEGVSVVCGRARGQNSWALPEFHSIPCLWRTGSDGYIHICLEACNGAFTTHRG